MSIGIVLLCRYESQRLPGKILREICGRTVLGHIVERIRRGALNYPIVVATSTDPSDDPIAEYCRRARLDCFRGSLEDVAGRFLACAQRYGWEFAARINGDNVFLDSSVLQSSLDIAATDIFDFVTNVPGRSFPYGMSVEIVRISFYAEQMALVDNLKHREHVTSWFYDNPSVGRRYVLENRICPEAAGLQLALDTPADLDTVQYIMEHAIESPPILGLREIFKIVGRRHVLSPWRGSGGPLLIAEIGGNHEGDFGAAKAMTEAAIGSGADYVKFQIYRGDSLVSPVESPDRHRHFQRFELSPEQHIELAQMCRSADIGYLSSVWDREVLEWIDPYMDIYKIGSGDLTAWPLLREFARRGKPILLSTGLATLDEVLQTVTQIQEIDTRYCSPEWLCILQCTSMYPIPDRDAHLRVMDVFRSATGVAVGYSDHTVGTTALRVAAAMGAEALEFHFTDRREGKTFRDHKVSLTADEVRALKRDIMHITEFRGGCGKLPQESEVSEGHHISFRRAVYLRRPVRAGQIISSDDLILLRPNRGTDARNYEDLVGAKALRDLNAFTAIKSGVDYKPIFAREEK